MIYINFYKHNFHYYLGQSNSRIMFCDITNILIKNKVKTSLQFLLDFSSISLKIKEPIDHKTKKYLTSKLRKTHFGLYTTNK